MTKVKRYSIYLDPKTHAQLRKLAFVRKQTISSVVCACVQDYIALTTKRNLQK